MPEYLKSSGHHNLRDGSGCHGVASLESILCTEELRTRPTRAPDYNKESRALVALAHALADAPRSIFQALADKILEVSRAGSAGLSLLTTHDGGKRFYWPAIAGRWRPHIGGGTPRDFGPCGDVLDRNTPLLFRHIEKRYSYFRPVTPAVEECLLVPFYVGGHAVGTLWAVAHDDRRKFDVEDQRLMTSLGEFASSAYQVVASLDLLKSEVTERKRAEQELRDREEQVRARADGLEIEVRLRTQELRQRNAEVLRQTKELRELSARLLQTQDEERRRIARDLHDSAGQIVTVLSLNLTGIIHHVRENPVVDKAIGDSLELVQQLSKEIRTLSYLLHPPLLDETGLPGAIRWYAQGLAERSGLKIELVMVEDFGRLPDEMEVAIFRIAQECLTNIHRHSGGKMAAIQLSRDAGNVLLEIQDDGTGIPDQTLTAIRTKRSGVGITGMRERVHHLNGIMSIESSANGTKISVTLPVSTTTH
jgi:signal transduction histidine kinase